MSTSPKPMNPTAFAMLAQQTVLFILSITSGAVLVSAAHVTAEYPRTDYFNEYLP